MSAELFLLFLVVLLGTSTQARANTLAQDDAKVAVLPIEFSGLKQPDLEKRLGDALGQGLERGDVAVLSDEDIRPHLRGPGACDSDCQRELLEVTGASYLVRTQVTLSDRVYAIRLDIIGKQLEVEGTAAQECEICGEQEVLDLLTDQAGNVATRLEVLFRSAPSLSVVTNPPGARVFVDGELVGTSPFTTQLEQGTVSLRLELDGHIARERTITAITGLHEKVDIELQPVPAAASGGDNGKPGRAMVIAGAVSLGLGAAVAGGGAALVAIDSNQHKGNCSGENVDTNGTCAFSYDTMVGGAVALGVGGALAITGAVLLGVGAKRNKKAELETRAHVYPAGQGLVVRF
jgi:hypothetical protein